MSNKLDFDRFMDEFSDTRKQASVDAVFGTPVESNGRMVIPIAAAAYGFGMGAGMDEKSAPAEGSKEGSGLGGGSGYIVRPAALAVIDQDGVKIKSIVNDERIAIAGMLTGAWAVFWMARVLLRLLATRK